MSKKFLEMLFNEKFRLQNKIASINAALMHTETECTECGHMSGDRLRIEKTDCENEKDSIDRLIDLYFSEHANS